MGFRKIRVKGKVKYRNSDTGRFISKLTYDSFKTREIIKKEVEPDKFIFTDSFTKKRVSEKEYTKFINRKIKRIKTKTGQTVYYDSYNKGFISKEHYKINFESFKIHKIKRLKKLPVGKPAGIPKKPRKRKNTRTRFKFVFVKGRAFIPSNTLDYSTYSEYIAGNKAVNGTFSIEEMANKTSFNISAVRKFFLEGESIGGSLEYIVYEINELFKENKLFGIQGKTLVKKNLKWSNTEHRKIILYLASLK